MAARKNKKARILSESGPLCEKEWEGARLRASSARLYVVIALQTSKPRLHGAHERIPARDGAVVRGGDAGFHVGSLPFKLNESSNACHRFSDDRKRTVKSLYGHVNARDNAALCLLHPFHKVPDHTVIRRRNALALFQEFMSAAVTEGAPPKGLEQSFAAAMQISPSMWSQIKSSRPIGDKLARQLEHRGGKPAGWLDEVHGIAPVPNPAEERFLELARAAWRARNAKGKRELARLLKTAGAAAST